MVVIPATAPAERVVAIPPGLADETAAAAVPVLDTVTTCEALLLPTAVAGNVNDVGLRDSVAEPVPPRDHCAYRYLLNVDGISSTHRLRMMMACGGLLLYVKPEWMEFYYYKLVPWKHFVPLPLDPADRTLLRNLLRRLAAQAQSADPVTDPCQLVTDLAPDRLPDAVDGANPARTRRPPPVSR